MSSSSSSSTDCRLENPYSGLKRIKVHRLFYVDCDASSNDRILNFAADFKGLTETTRALALINGQKIELFGIYGDQDALKNRLHGLFPDDHSGIETCFQGDAPMPTIYTIHQDQKMIFTLVHCDFSREADDELFKSVTAVMQRFLQDICPNIVICPSEDFFVHFSDEHSFHGRPHQRRIYDQIKTTDRDIQPAKLIQTQDQESLRTLFGANSQQVLQRNVGPQVFCYRKTKEEDTDTKNKFQLLKRHLEERIDLDNVTLHTVLTNCQQCNIQVSQSQQVSIKANIESIRKNYQKVKSSIEDVAKSLVKDLISRSSYIPFVSSHLADLKRGTKDALYSKTTDWLINPVYNFQTAVDFTQEIVATILSNRPASQHDVVIPQAQSYEFVEQLNHHNRKNETQRLLKQLIDAICLAVQSENQFDVHFYLYQLTPVPSNPEQGDPCISITSSRTSHLTFSSFASLLKITHLPETDRRIFADRMKLIACFKTDDDAEDILVVRVPKYVDNQMKDTFCHSVFALKNNHLRLVVDYTLDKIAVTFACNSTSQTIIMFNINNNSVSKFVLKSSGEKERSDQLKINTTGRKLTGIKSMALTVAQDLLVFIDSDSNVYSIDVTKDETSLTILYKSKDGSQNNTNFIADNGEMYNYVQTIGEMRPIFFFQSSSCVDIIDRNMYQLQSIKLGPHSLASHMQIFTDLATTYCILFNDQQYEAYAIENLISDTRIQLRRNSTDPNQSSKQNYVGNRLLDVIKRGEIQFGPMIDLEKRQYHLISHLTFTAHAERINRYFRALCVHAEIHLIDNIPAMQFSSNYSNISRQIYGKVPLQLCTIDRGSFIPLNDGRRDVVENLARQCFTIEERAREISFAQLDHILGTIENNIPIIGVIGRQSTGKSYLMNRLFGARFAVAAGRCTDGIWMSYAVCDDHQYVVLDCEGLFSDQRTEDEEMKLLAFLSAMCDVTILSQDLGFSRYQDRLFGLLSESVKKIKKAEKLFQGYLLVAVRDISNSNAKEALEAAEKKFMDLQRRGRSGFLDQLFSESFTIQPLHHFEDNNFNYELADLKKEFIKLSEKKRWSSGKELISRMKILLVQLYADDFADSSEVQTQMKIDDLKKMTKKIWIEYDVEDDKKQVIEETFENKAYRLEINHKELKFDEASMENSYERLYGYLVQAISFDDQTKEKKNRLLAFLNGLIPEILGYRRQQVTAMMMKSFEKLFPSVDENMGKKRTEFFDRMEQYMSSFKLRMCLKKCSSCDLKCVQHAQHTEIAKTSLAEAKQQLQELSSQLNYEHDVAQRDKLDKNINQCKEESNVLSKEKNLLENELRYLEEKEDLEKRMNSLKSEKSGLDDEIANLQQTIEQTTKKATDLMPNSKSIKDVESMIKPEIESLLNHRLYQDGELEASIKKFYGEGRALDLAPMNFNNGDLRPDELNQLIILMQTKIDHAHQTWLDVQSRVTAIERETESKRKQSCVIVADIKQLEYDVNELISKKDGVKGKIDVLKKNVVDLQNQKVEVNVEKEQLEEKIKKAYSSSLTEEHKIEQYIDRLRVDSSSQENRMEELEKAQKLLEDFRCIEKNVSDMKRELEKLQKKHSSLDKMMKDFGDEADEYDKQRLVEMQNKIDETQGVLNGEMQKKSSIQNENDLLKTILAVSTPMEPEKDRLEKIREKTEDLDKQISARADSLSTAENAYRQYVINIRLLKSDLEKKRDEKAKLDEQIKVQTDEYQTGKTLFESMSNLEGKLTKSLGRLEQLGKAKQLIDDDRALSERLKEKQEEISKLQDNYDRLRQELDHKAAMREACKYSSSLDCDARLLALNRKLDDVQREVETMETQREAMNKTVHLEREIKRLETEAQKNCDCETDHKCSGHCEICIKQSESDSKVCIFAAGHAGEHKCDAGHVCKQLCQICQLRGDAPNQCYFPYKHQHPAHHQCERVHPCPRTCEVCSEPCSIPFDVKGHQRHQCQSKVCWKSCMFSCERICVAEDHDHDSHTEEVQFAKDEKTVTMKKHLCGQSHRCLGICNTSGVCKLSQYTVELRTWETESGETFTYDHIEVNATRNKCEIMIDAGLYSHTGTIQMHKCAAQHTCDQRCPDCNTFCQQPYGHRGHHSAAHRNKDQHIFTSTNPSEAVEIRSGDSSTSIIRKYKIGESSQPENCSVSCKRRGRGHFHLMECPGGDDCYERKLGMNARHSNEVYYYGIDQPSPKKYDEILCSAYWSMMKWSSPVNDVDRKLIDSCNFYCDEHVRKDDRRQIIKDAPDGFCTTGAWHQGSHTFQCKDKHLTEDSYKGVDVCFVIDTTGSMASYIEKVKLTITRIIEENEARLKKIKASGTFQFGIVDYRDHEPEGDYVFRQCQFTSHGGAIEYVQQLKADSGGDTPEAVLDGLDAACDLKWRDQADHLLFHVLDSPPHGKIFFSGGDRWPEGCPCGKTPSDVFSKMKQKKISYHVLMCSSSLNMMISEFQKHIDVKTLNFNEEVSFEKMITRRVHQQLEDTEQTLKQSMI